MKFKKGFASDYEKQLQEAEKQKQLREKYNIEDDAKVVKVVKLSPGQYAIKTAGNIIRISALIAAVLLAAIGVIALLYPSPRQELLIVFEDIKLQVLQFVGLGGLE